MEWEGTSKESMFVNDAGRMIAKRWKWSSEEDICRKNNLGNFSSYYINVPSKKTKNTKTANAVPVS